MEKSIVNRISYGTLYAESSFSEFWDFISDKNSMIDEPSGHFLVTNVKPSSNSNILNYEDTYISRLYSFTYGNAPETVFATFNSGSKSYFYVYRLKSLHEFVKLVDTNISLLDYFSDYEGSFPVLELFYSCDLLMYEFEQASVDALRLDLDKCISSLEEISKSNMTSRELYLPPCDPANFDYSKLLQSDKVRSFKYEDNQIIVETNDLIVDVSPYDLSWNIGSYIIVLNISEDSPKIRSYSIRRKEGPFIPLNLKDENLSHNEHWKYDTEKYISSYITCEYNGESDSICTGNLSFKPYLDGGNYQYVLDILLVLINQSNADADGPYIHWDELYFKVTGKNRCVHCAKYNCICTNCPFCDSKSAPDSLCSNCNSCNNCCNCDLFMGDFYISYSMIYWRISSSRVRKEHVPSVIAQDKKFLELYIKSSSLYSINHHDSIKDTTNLTPEAKELYDYYIKHREEYKKSDVDNRTFIKTGD